MNVVFFGSSSYVIPLIEKLREQLEISHVFTTEQSITNAVPNFCTSNNIPYTAVKTLSNSDTLYKLYAANAPFAVLADFGAIIPPHLIYAFPKGILNIHPSLLPKYRGPTPVQTALRNGDTKTGVTIIRLDNDIDHGPIVAQEEVKIQPTDTAQSLYQRLFSLGIDVLLANMQDYVSGLLIPKEQDHSKATFTNHLTRQDGYIDCSKSVGKNVLKNMIRAYYPWPGVWIRLQSPQAIADGGQAKIRIKNQELRIKFLPALSHPEIASTEYNRSDSGSHPFLLQVEGKKPVSIKDFLNGYPELRETITKLL